MKNLMTLVLLALLWSTAYAQAAFRVGDTVEYRCNCFGKEWVRAKVEAIDGNTVRVRWGNVRNQVATVINEPDTVRALTGAQNTPGENQPPKNVGTVDNNISTADKLANEDKVRWAFRDEALNKYYQTVAQFAPSYDEQYISGGSPNTPAEWQKAMNDLNELDALCKSKYPGITDSLIYLREGIVDYRYAAWCEIAARRIELEKLARTSLAKKQISLTVTLDNLNFAFNHRMNRVPDETQMLIWERAKWKQEQTVTLKPRFVEFGVQMPADFFAEVEKKADELKTLIEQTAPDRSWEQPPFRDAAVEAFIKGKYAKEYPGAEVLKAGLDYKIWEVRKGLSYIGSDSAYRYYKVEYNSYKRGWVLMKAPDRPFCQASEWIVGRGAKGMVVVSLGGSGIFVKCP